MTKFKRPFYLVIILLAALAAQAQTERPARTWIGGGAILTRSSDEGGQTITGAYLDAAYDLRYGFQGRLFGEYRRRPLMGRLFTGDGHVFEAASELRYAPALVYHIPGEGSVRPLIGSGLLVTKHYFRQQPPRDGLSYRTVYNGSQNPFITAGAGLCKSNELTFTYYFADIYSSSRLRGYGADLTHTKKLAGLLYLRIGAKGKYWLYREGVDYHERKSSEASVFVGFNVQ
jgi:hypothetical protein